MANAGPRAFPTTWTRPDYRRFSGARTSQGRTRFLYEEPSNGLIPMGDWCVFNTTPTERKQGRVFANRNGHGEQRNVIREKDQEQEALEWKRTIRSPYSEPNASALAFRTQYRIAHRRVLPLDTEPPNGCPWVPPNATFTVEGSAGVPPATHGGQDARPPLRERLASPLRFPHLPIRYADVGRDRPPMKYTSRVQPWERTPNGRGAVRPSIAPDAAFAVIPANAGIQDVRALDSRLCGNNG